jgi:hypothetical protein
MDGHREIILQEAGGGRREIEEICLRREGFELAGRPDDGPENESKFSQRLGRDVFWVAAASSARKSAGENGMLRLRQELRGEEKQDACGGALAERTC